MKIKTEKKYDIVIVGGNIFSAQLAVQLANIELKLLLISHSDISDCSDNFFIETLNSYKPKQNHEFYSSYSHSVIPTDVFILNNTNVLDSVSKKIQSVVRKKLISKKDFKNYEKTLITKANITIKKEKSYKISYSRLCIDTIKTAKATKLDILSYTSIKELKTGKIIINSGKEIKADLIINTDFSLLEDELKNSVVTTENYIFTIPKFVLNIKNPLKIIDKNTINIIPYFSEIFICSDNKKTDIIIDKIKNNIGIEINKKLIIKEHIVRKYNSNILSRTKKIIHVFENDYHNNKEKINYVLSEVLNLLSLETADYKEYKLSTSFNIQADKYNFIRMLEQGYLQVQETGVTPNEYTVLFYRYGNDLEKITEKAYDFYNDKETRKHAWLYAELWYSVNYEFVKTPDDFIYRRTNFGLINQLDDEKREIITNFIDNAK